MFNPCFILDGSGAFEEFAVKRQLFFSNSYILVSFCTLVSPTVPTDLPPL